MYDLLGIEIYFISNRNLSTKFTSLQKRKNFMLKFMIKTDLLHNSGEINDGKIDIYYVVYLK